MDPGFDSTSYLILIVEVFDKIFHSLYRITNHKFTNHGTRVKAIKIRLSRVVEIVVKR